MKKEQAKLMTEYRQELFSVIENCYGRMSSRSLKFLPSGENSLIEKFCWLVACGDILLPEYRLQWPHITWWNDEGFTAYLKKFREDKGFNTNRRWDLSQLLRLTSAVHGDMAECGTYQGASAQLMADMCKAQGKHLHIFDSFDGLSEPTESDGTHWKKHALSANEDVVNKNLTDYFGTYTTYKGWIPDRFEAVSTSNFSFLHIDVDLYQPTKDSIEFFYQRLAPGAVCVCDDYGSTLCPGAKQAMDEFLADKPEKMLLLSGGSGFFIKTVATL